MVIFEYDGDVPAVVPLAGDVDRNKQYIGSILASTSVVPLAGDVDRNLTMYSWWVQPVSSSPSRGTWIEMRKYPDSCTNRPCRPPRGGRG